jgi:hypothetical protein
MEKQELIARIEGLNREEVLEAALALRDTLGLGDLDDDAPEAAAGFVEELREQPYAALDDVEDLARAALVVAALEPDRREDVEQIVARVGEKNFIFGGAEIIAIGIAAALVIERLRGGKKETHDETVVTESPDGGKQIVHRERTVYRPNEKMGKIVSALFGG